LNSMIFSVGRVLDLEKMFESSTQTRLDSTKKNVELLNIIDMS